MTNKTNITKTSQRLLLTENTPNIRRTWKKFQFRKNIESLICIIVNMLFERLFPD